MKRRITLYIGGRKADISDQSFFLLNYQMEDLQNPTIVKNSYSQQVTLPGTCRNNRIFGAIWRPDRVSGSGGATGADFNASKRTPFALYADDGAVLESGYVKLDEVVRNGRFVREYRVSLFGGLGAFFYELSYNADGTKKTLADLTFLERRPALDGTGDPIPDEEFAFNIDKAYVEEAWDAAARGFNLSRRIFSIINFAPCYDGIPKDFSADKAVAAVADPQGIPTSVTTGGKTYGGKGGYVLANLDGAKDGWAMKEFRSYLQRPVVRISEIIRACAYPGNNGGYSFDTDAAVLGLVDNLWLTRPLLPSLGTMKETTSGSATISWTPESGSGKTGYATIGGTVPAGTKETVRLRLDYTATATSSEDELSGHFDYTMVNPGGKIVRGANSIVFLQAVAYNAAEDTVLGVSNVQTLCDAVCGLNFSGQDLANLCGFVPMGEAEYNAVTPGAWEKTAANTFTFASPVSLEVQGYDIAKVKVIASVYQLTAQRMNNVSDIQPISIVSGGDIALYDGATLVPTTATTATSASTPTVAVALDGAIRTGAYITKRTLLSTPYTPAEVLLGIAKMFGLYFYYDNSARKVVMMSRNTLYEDETIDLSKRVDTGQEVKIVPMTFSSRWYDFRQTVVEGAFAQAYKTNYGRDYGMQRVNTGYDFDASAVDLLNGSCIKSCAAVKDSSPYWYWIIDASYNYRSPVFMDPAVTATLWAADGTTTEVPVPQPGADFTAYPYNEDFPGYDSMDRAEFRDGENNPVDGADVLLELQAVPLLPYFKVTDDFSEMFTLSGGKSCWSLEAAPQTGPIPGIYVPHFSRYLIDTLTNEMRKSLDFGVPSELAIPGIIYDPSTTIYGRGWKRYIADRYDKDTRVLTARVDLSGLQVGQGLLRKFYWYDGALWVLNKIVNHSLTTYGPTECEFVQVRDKDNYLNGQTY